MKNTVSLLVLFVGFGIPAVAVAQSPPESSPTLVAIKMDAEWCPKCHAMNPKLERIMPEYDGGGILFLKWDMDDFAVYQSGLLAARLGLSDLFADHKGRTGYMVIVDGRTNEELKTLTSEQSESELKSDIDELIREVQN